MVADEHEGELNWKHYTESLSPLSVVQMLSRRYNRLALDKSVLPLSHIVGRGTVETSVTTIDYCQTTYHDMCLFVYISDSSSLYISVQSCFLYCILSCS